MRRFDIDGVIEQGEGLQRGVAAGAADDAGHARGGIKVHKAGIWRAALEHDIKAAPVFLFASTDFVGVLLATDLFPETVRLRRVNGWTAFFGAEQTSDSQGIVANGFGLQAEAWTASIEVIGIVFLNQLGRERGILAEGG